MAELAFVDKVAARAGVPPEQARPLTEAVLRTLTERLSGGEAARWPPPGRRAEPAAGQGRRAAGGVRLRRVPAPGGRPRRRRPTGRRTGTRAVLQTMHRVVGHREFEDVLAQLPADLRALAQPLPHGP
ncbi:DUF2267 domain-containing protein [Micromonospora sp. M12]